MNRHPRGSELALYGLAGGGRTLEEYAAIAFLPNLNETGDVIVVQGFTLSGTQSAAEFLTDKDRFNALMAAAIRGRRTIPHFEILLKTSRVNGVGSRAEVVAWRIYS
jgi:hypothetical protein